MKSKEIFKITKMVSTLVRIFMLVIAALLITSPVFATDYYSIFCK